MSQILIQESKYEIIQESKYEKYARLLETTNITQRMGCFYRDGMMCAVGVIMSSLGWRAVDYRDQNEEEFSSNTLPFIKQLRDEIGSDMFVRIEGLNDGICERPHSFKEIAQWLREQK